MVHFTGIPPVRQFQAAKAWAQLAFAPDAGETNNIRNQDMNRDLCAFVDFYYLIYQKKDEEAQRYLNHERRARGLEYSVRFRVGAVQRQSPDENDNMSSNRKRPITDLGPQDCHNVEDRQQENGKNVLKAFTVFSTTDIPLFCQVLDPCRQSRGCAN
jgi:hypothetical protein